MRYKYTIFIFYILIILFTVILVKKQVDNFQVQHKNILGTPMIPCSMPSEKTTGYYRDGYCATGPTDTGTHVVCAVVDDKFLEFTKSMGNDLTTPQNSFPGLVAGDKWCLCALRWREAYNAGKAPKIIPESTSDASTNYVSKNILMNYAIASK